MKMNKNIFLNKNMIMATNFHKTAILVKSPFNDGSGIWFANKWTKQNSNWNNYFSVSIVSNQFYRLYKYNGYQVYQIKEVRGSDIIDLNQFYTKKTNWWTNS